MTKIVLVVAAHTDDEALGCGGTIARHVAEGDSVHAVFLADGVTSRPKASTNDIEERYEAAAKAQKVLGIRRTYMLGFPDQRTDSVPFLEVVQALEKVIQEIRPEVIYTHHYGDLNVDHRIAHQAVMTVCRPVPGSSFREIYAFEVLSSTEWNSPGSLSFVPNVFVDISAHLETKIKALEAYGLEMREEPHSRSIINAKRQSEYRGASVGVRAAEGLMLIRRVK
ncbi:MULTISPECIES: PIG-L deacetylase family protein [Halomonadaceae]|uniref:PIG-L deacetylase family protein n=1 Tax=Halomonadaceae TaxID=28256 RepID=UPI0012F25483|nr:MULTISPECIES: PIG-L deacetylase family protein [Halomonas]CAD5257040.1 GlcNAc-PI de-N-acetylase [Halomonas sp. 59]CAD5257269.1 GlcNAc-PI de-N-acetylase [Halomonas sp. 113]CAD5271105.1 GlcNAc-PI de-N-acetylase [Halomonas sp. I3]CAD5291603.1 GlcNAc-PI de-N-acetylase [Halomonas sp. 156]VXB23491.1 GlcNAc-PI de-N-acetylase [Halomonas titanicae]